MSGVNFNRPSGVNVGVNNPGSTVYVRGNETTDLSIRFIAESESSLAAVLQARQDGVWNKGELILDSNTLKLGEASLSSAFAYLEMEAPGQLAALGPHIEFDDDGTKFVHTPVLGELLEFDVVTVEASELVGTSIGEEIDTNFSALIDSIIHKVGSIGATEQVTYTVYEGVDNTGPIKNQINFPASTFAAGNTVVIPFNRSLGVAAGEPEFFEMASDVAFSIATDDEGRLLTTVFAYQLEELGIYTENLMLDEEFNTIFDEDLNPMYGSQF